MKCTPNIRRKLFLWSQLIQAQGVTSYFILEYVLAPEAIEFIKSVPGPIGVVSVAGLYRTGKSYLLNQMLLNRSSGFGVGPTINPCTKGLWCWGTPIKGETPDG